MSNGIYYRANIRAQNVDGADLHIAELGWCSEDGYEPYTSVAVGFDPEAAEAFAKAWRSGMAPIIMMALEAQR